MNNGENKSIVSELSDDIITIYSTDDAKIKTLGMLLSSDVSRNIIEMLFSETLTANQISEKMDISLPLVKFHLIRMQDIGIVKITKIEKSSKSHNMKYYAATQFAIVVLPRNVICKAKKSKLLHNSFKMICKFASVGVAAISTWFITQFIQNIKVDPLDLGKGTQTEKGIVEQTKSFVLDSFVIGGIEIQLDVFWSAIATISVIVIGTTIIIIAKKK